MISGFGSAVTYVALPLQMYQLTKSTVMVGLIGVAEFLPMLLMAFLGGVLADRFDRRKLILATDAIMAAVLLGLTYNASFARPRVWPLFAAASILAALNSIHRPSMEAMTQQLVLPGEMTAVGALTSIRYCLAYIAGPGLAGWMTVKFGAGVAFGFDAITYILGVAFLLMMQRTSFHGGEEGGITWHTLVEGWHYALQRKDLLGTYLIDLNAMFFGMPNALFPAFGDIYGARNVGLLYSAGAFGALVFSLTSGWTKKVNRHGLAIAWAASVWGLAIIGFGLTTNLWLALLFLGLAGAADNVSGIFRMTIWNQTIPARLRGRTAAIEMVSYLSGPYLGNAEAGFAAKLLGVGPSVAVGGAICVIGSVLITWALPDFRHYVAPLTTADEQPDSLAG